MLIVMSRQAGEDQLQTVKQFLTDRDFDFHQSTGADRVIIGVIGETASIDRDQLRELPGVLEVFKIPDDKA